MDSRGTDKGLGAAVDDGPLLLTADLELGPEGESCWGAPPDFSTGPVGFLCCCVMKEPKMGEANGGATCMMEVVLDLVLRSPSSWLTRARLSVMVASAAPKGLRIGVGPGLSAGSFGPLVASTLGSFRSLGRSRKVIPSSRAFLISSKASLAISAPVSCP